MVVSGTSMLGIVKHLGFNERWWFQEVFAARDVEFPWREDDPDAEFRIEEHESAESVFDFYVQECDKSRAIVAEANLDDIAGNSKSERSLRWILSHMLEETCSPQRTPRHPAGDDRRNDRRVRRLSRSPVRRGSSRRSPRR